MSSPARPLPDTYRVEIAGITRDLPRMEVKPGVRIAILNILGDTELVEAAAAALAQHIDPMPDFFVTAETKSVPLVHAISRITGVPYIVLRKSHKPYMGAALSAETLSITTGAPQTLFLDAKDRDSVAGRNVILLDDVISTGSTLQGMRLIMQKAGATIAAEAAILTEGDRAQWHDIIALGHLPVWVDDEATSS